jgi:hypothetical protein
MAATPTNGGDLGEVLRRETKELAAAARTNPGSVDEERLAALERLSRLYALERSLASPWRRRLMSGAALLFAVIVVLALYGWRLSSTAVSGELRVRELSLALGKAQSVIPGRHLARLSIEELDSVRLPVGDDSSEVVVASAITLQVDSGLAAPGTVDLDEWPFPAATKISLRIADPAGGYDWFLAFPEESKHLKATATVSGPVLATWNGQQRLLATRYGAMVEIYPSAEVRVTTVYLDTATRILPPVPAARSISFDERPRYRDLPGEFSSLLGGSVTLDDLGAKEMKFGPGQSLRFVDSRMEIPYLALERNSLRLRFSGEVKGVSTGTDRPRNLMPRKLEWIASSPAWLLVGGAVLTVMGYLLALPRWWFQAR